MVNRRYGRVHPTWPALIPDCPTLVSPTEGSEVTWDALLVAVTTGNTIPDSVTFFYKKVGDSEYTELEGVLDETIDGVTTWIGTPEAELDPSESYEYYAVATRNENTSIGCAAGAVTFTTEGIDYAPIVKPLITHWWTFNGNSTDEAVAASVLAGFNSPTIVTAPDGRGHVVMSALFVSGSIPNSKFYRHVGSNPDTTGYAPVVVSPQFGWTFHMNVEFSAIPSFTHSGDNNFFGDRVTIAGPGVTTQATGSSAGGIGFALVRESGVIYLAACAKNTTCRMTTAMVPGVKYNLTNTFNRTLQRMELYVNGVLHSFTALPNVLPFTQNQDPPQFLIGPLEAGDEAITMYVRDVFFATDGMTQEMIQWLYDGQTYLRPYADIKAAVYEETYEEWVADGTFKDYVDFNTLTNHAAGTRADALLVNSVGGALPTIDTSNTTPLPGPLNGDGYLIIDAADEYAQFDSIDMTGGGVFGTASFSYRPSGFGSSTFHNVVGWQQRYRTTPTTPTTQFANARLWSITDTPRHTNHEANGTVASPNELYPAGDNFISGAFKYDTWQHMVMICAPTAANTYNGSQTCYGMINGVVTVGDNTSGGTPAGQGPLVNYTHVLCGGSRNNTPNIKIAHVGNIFGGTAPHPSYFTKLWQILTGY